MLETDVLLPCWRRCVWSEMHEERNVILESCESKERLLRPDQSTKFFFGVGQQLVEGLHYSSTVRDEPFNQTNELLQLRLVVESCV